ncbi:MAG: FlgD immunoglobulin-like domain containing protein [Spirochaetaceae bacterium]
MNTTTHTRSSRSIRQPIGDRFTSSLRRRRARCGPWPWLRRLPALALLALAGSAQLSGQGAPTGAQDTLRLLDASLVPAAVALASSGTPAATRLNPALGALEEDLVLSGSYVGAFASSWANSGHSAVVSATIPTRYATLSAGTAFMMMDTAAMNLGTTVTMHGSVSKPLGTRFTAGAGVDMALGGSGGNFDLGLTTSYGVHHRIPRLWTLTDLRWGLALTGVGLPYNPVAGAGGVPAPLTPRLEAGANLLEGEGVTLGVDAGISVPTFRSVTLDLGTRIALGDHVSGRLGSSIDFGASPGEDGSTQRGYLGGSVSISYGGVTAGGGERSRPVSAVSMSRLYDTWLVGTSFRSGMGTLDAEPPRVAIELQETVALSPNNDGIQDHLRIPVNISDNRFLESYELRVRNNEGELVRRIRNPENREETRSEGGLWSRITAVETGIPAPEYMIWTGTDDTGQIVPDGRYSVILTAVDSRGNRSTSDPLTVRIDNTAPAADVTAGAAAARDATPEDTVAATLPDLRLIETGVGTPSLELPPAGDLIFSPDGDGNKDVLVIEQQAEEEAQWFGTIEDSAGAPVRTWEWSGTPPERLVWDGTNEAGDMVPDGVYTYRLEATDEAGNAFATTVPNIVKNVQATPVGIAIERSAFSPNGDGNADFLRMLLDVPTTEGAEEWRVTVHQISRPGGASRNGSFVFARGGGVPPAKLDFAGLDGDGARLPDGRYEARLEVTYENGNRPEATSPEFVIDTVAPEAAVTADTRVFSPDGDGSRDTVTFFHEATSEEVWHGEIVDAAGEVVRTYRWQRTPAPSLVWDGTTEEGTLAEDGTYSYRLSGVDGAGNSRTSAPVEVRVDTGETGVLLSAGERVFSPNADGVRDTVSVFPRVERPDAVAEYTATITPAGSEEEEEVRRLTGNSVPERLTWDGFNAAGRRVSDGEYVLTLSVRYTNGSVEATSIGGLTVDTSAPTVTLSAEYLLFSPNGDGRRDTVSIRQDGSAENLWEGTVVDADGSTVRSYFWKGEPADFDWDGTDAAGNVVPNGVYGYRVESRDAAGNRTTRSLDGITVDNRDADVFVTATSDAISPNDDGYRDSTAIRSYVSLTDGVERWELEILDATGTPVREFAGEDLRPQFELPWDGTDGDGTIVEGEFTPVLTVWYEKGDRPRAQGPQLLVDASPPEIDVDLDPVPFSPDNDGVDDELSIGLSVSDRSDIARWRFRILDRTGAYFNEFSGRGAPSDELTWNGRAEDGELVISAEDYPYLFEVTDVLGNTAVTEGRIPVDILVVRDNGRLKVQIADITFAPNSAELITDEFTERGAKNRAIVRRLAEVFAKYDTYDIRIEGHAVNITGTDREEREELGPLSEARAESVRQALIEEGLNPRRLSVAGRGGTEPIVPHTDLDNRWKNRRVEFVLIR